MAINNFLLCSNGVLQEIIPFNGSTEENGVKGDSTPEKLAKLKPAFVKPHGTHTAANSSFLSDGASAALITSEARAKELGLTPRSTFKVKYMYTSSLHYRLLRYVVLCQSDATNVIMHMLCCITCSMSVRLRLLSACLLNTSIHCTMFYVLCMSIELGICSSRSI
jgi:Thiolase, N-terminal domain